MAVVFCLARSAKGGFRRPSAKGTVPPQSDSIISLECCTAPTASPGRPLGPNPLAHAICGQMTSAISPTTIMSVPHMRTAMNTFGALTRCMIWYWSWTGTGPTPNRDVDRRSSFTSGVARVTQPKAASRFPDPICIGWRHAFNPEQRLLSHPQASQFTPKKIRIFLLKFCAEFYTVNGHAHQRSPIQPLHGSPPAQWPSQNHCSSPSTGPPARFEPQFRPIRQNAPRIPRPPEEYT